MQDLPADAASQTSGRNWGRITLALALAPLAVLLLANLTNLLHGAADAISYPFEFDYGEGIVWQQMRNIAAGQGYGPLGVYPAIVYHYPPVYHLTVAACSALFGIDQLAAGRAVSIGGSLVMAILAGNLSAQLVGRDSARRVRLACGMVGGLLLLSFEPVIAWSTLMRVDMLCHMLTLTGLILALRSIDRMPLAICAGVAFTLAIFTKQTAIAGPAAATLMLLLIAPRRAWLLVTTCLVLGLSALTWLIWSTDGGFLTHILRYNVNRLDWTQLSRLIAELNMELMWVIAGCVGAWLAIGKLLSVRKQLRHPGSWRAAYAHDRSIAATLLIIIYLILTTAMLPLILKSGAMANYLIEWFCVLSILAGLAFKPLATAVWHKEAPVPYVVAALFAIGLPLQIYSVALAQSGDVASIKPMRLKELTHAVAMIEKSPKPVISDDMTLLIRAGRPVEWESAITAELSHKGIYDERAFAALVRKQHFGFFITEGRRGKWIFDRRYNPVVAEAIDAAYPEKIRYADRIFHFPASAAPPIGRPE